MTRWCDSTRPEIQVDIRYEHIERAQALMREQGITAIVVMNHDDYRYFFGTDRTQPRAIIPQAGPPTLIVSTAEEPELREAVGSGPVLIFSSIGGQIHNVVTRLREEFSPSAFPLTPHE